MSKKMGIIGSGQVGITLANGFHKHGYTVMIGTNDPEKHPSIQEKTNGKVSIGSFADVANFSDTLILAVKGTAAEEAIQIAGIDLLKDKIVLDATNPIAEAPPVNGVIPFFTSLDESLMERLQNLAPETKFVKCFSCVGNSLMIDPDFGGVKPTMFIAGNDDQAKQTTTQILTEIGWETEDMGKAEGARAIEPLCILWCIPGMLRSSWRHAFKLLR
ncbi:MAG TPA: NAD(P)-binding domain-containing protein [Saprospiraceae bacterium]|nr:NAD(P)-binding domain-containing protein [Saprospiraceae bacterium]